MKIVAYDLDDNIVAYFDSIKECAEYFKTTENSLQKYFWKKKYGIGHDKKQDPYNGK